MSFVLDWQKKLGYKDDPFVEQPSGQVRTFFVDRDQERERLNLFVIKQQRFGILHGPKGSGKSTLSTWLAQQLGSKVKVIQVQGKMVEHKKPFVEHVLSQCLNVVEKNVTKPHEHLAKDEIEAFILQKLRKKRIILIIDDAQLLIRENKHLLKDVLKECPKSQVLLVLERILKEHEAWGKDDLGLALKDMSEEALTELLKVRIEGAGGHGTHPFDKKELDGLLEKSKKNPVRLLALARERAMELSLTVGPAPKPEEKKAKKKDKKAEKKEEKEQEKAVEKSIDEDKAADPGDAKDKKDAKDEKKGDDKEKDEPKGEEGEHHEEEKDHDKHHKKKKDKWFSLKIVKDKSAKPIVSVDHEEEEGHKGHKEQHGEELDESLLEPRGDAAVDADMLNEIVTSHEAELKDDDDEIEVEDVIETLVEELDKKKG